MYAWYEEKEGEGSEERSFERHSVSVVEMIERS